MGCREDDTTEPKAVLGLDEVFTCPVCNRFEQLVAVLRDGAEPQGSVRDSPTIRGAWRVDPTRCATWTARLAARMKAD